MLVVTHLFVCDLCGHSQGFPKGNPQQTVNAGYCIVLPGTIPKGWSWVDGMLVCPKHRVVVDPEPMEEKTKDRGAFRSLRDA